MFPPKVLSTAFWENLVYPETSEAEITLPPIILLCLSVDNSGDNTWPQLHQLIESHFPQWQKVRVFNNFVYLFATPPKEDPQTRAHALLEAASALGIHLTVSAEEATGNLSAWQTAAQQTMAAVRNKIVHGTGRIYRFSDLGPKQDPTMLLSPREEELLLAIKTGRVEAARIAACKSSQDLFAANLYVLSHLRTRLRELAVLMTRSAVEAGLSDKVAFRELNALFLALDREHDYPKLEELYLEAAVRLAQLVLETNYKPSAIVQETKALLEKSFHQDLTLEGVAEELAVSQSHLSRSFRKEMGYTFTEYLNKLRLEEAARLLLDQSLSVTEVCFQVGFQSLPHFQRLFRDFYGQSPTSYRKGKL